MHRSNRVGVLAIYSVAVLLTLSGLYAAQAEQPESSASPQIEATPKPCVEGSNVSMVYGESTEECFIDFVTDSDLFFFQGTAGDKVWIVLRQLSGGLDPRMSVRDPVGVEIYIQACSNNCSLFAQVELPQTGQYQIEVSDSASDNTGSYQLDLERIGQDSSHVELAYGQSVDDTIDYVTDLDFFEFDGSAGDIVRFALRQTGGGLDPRIQVYDPNLVLLQNVVCSNNCSIGIIDELLTLSGRYLVTVSDSNVDNTGSYQLKIEKNPPVQNPVPLLIGVPITSTISPVTDYDFFTFEGVAGTLVNMILRQTSGAGLDPRFELFDPAGVRLLNQVCSDGCTISNSGFLLPTSGSYLVIVSDSNIDNTGSIELTIQCAFGNCDCLERDITGDGTVNVTDLLQLLGEWGPCPEPCASLFVNTPDDCPSDINRDCSVNVMDLLALLSDWGLCP